MSFRSKVRSITQPKIIVSIFGILLVIVVAFVIWFDWNMMKPYIERQVTEKTGREFQIKGDLDVDLSLNPQVTVEGISLANAEWGTEQPMLAVEKIQFRISLLDLLTGDIVLPVVSISHPKVVLEKSMDGKRNWDLIKDEEKEAELPEIGRVTLDQGTVIFRDPKTETDVTVNISTDPSVDARELPLNVTAEGTAKGLKFTAQAEGGEITSLTEKTNPYPIKAHVDIGTTSATAKGTVTGLAELAAMDMDFEVRGEDLSALYPIAGIVIFPSPPYEISGQLLHHETEWSLREFSGHVGKSDLSGSASFNTAGERPILRADVVSKVLDLKDLSGFIGARRAPQPEDSPAEKQEKMASIEAQRDRILPDQEFKVNQLHEMDADVKFTGKSIRNEDLPIEHLSVHLKIDDGLMTIDPANFAVGGGNIISSITVNARPDTPKAEVDTEFKQLQLSKLLPETEITEGSAGLIGGKLDMKSEGKSVGKLLASANGSFGLIMSGGQISNMMLEIIGLDAAEVLKFLAIGDETARIRCAVADFDIKKGIMSTEAFIIDTTDTNILVNGQISLAEETIDMKVSPKPKDPSIMSLRTPVHISGTFKDPTAYPDKTLAARVGAAILLGIFATPLAALIPTIETGPGEDHNCKALIESVKQPQEEKKKEGKSPQAEEG